MMMRVLPGLPQVPVGDRLTVLVQDSAARLLPGATVVVTSGERELGRLQTGADGRALLFPGWLGAARTFSRLTLVRDKAADFLRRARLPLHA